MLALEHFDVRIHALQVVTVAPSDGQTRPRRLGNESKYRQQSRDELLENIKSYKLIICRC
jgi:hypothetical protein